MSSIDSISIDSISPEKSPKKCFTEIKQSTKQSIDDSEGSSAHSHGTRASTRAAVKPMEPLARKQAKRPAVKSSKEPVKSSATSGDESPTPDPSPTPPLRQLSPRKAAQQHLFVTTTRSQTQKAVPVADGSKGTKGSAIQTKERSNRMTKPLTKSVELDVTEEPDKCENICDSTKTRVPLAQKQVMDIDESVTPDVFAPLLRLSPPPNGRDYCFNLDANEGICDLFL